MTILICKVIIMFTIKIMKNGPYLVSNLKKLRIESYIPDPTTHVQQSVIQSTLEVTGDIALCRCGQSKNKPYCDGSHETCDFNGQETADKTPYLERSQVFTGDGVNLIDDDRCAFARFCHREHGDVWELTESSGNPEYAKEAIEGASACPAGRLTAVLDHQLIEDVYEDVIIIAEDPSNKVSASLNVKGDFELIGADGELYEKRNRVALCRCGHSQNKPFCDASHVNECFQDNLIKE